MRARPNDARSTPHRDDDDDGRRQSTVPSFADARSRIDQWIDDVCRTTCADINAVGIVNAIDGFVVVVDDDDRLTWHVRRGPLLCTTTPPSTSKGHAPTDPSVWHTFMVHRPCAVYVYRESERETERARQRGEVMHYTREG